MNFRPFLNKINHNIKNLIAFLKGNKNMLISTGVMLVAICVTLSLHISVDPWCLLLTPAIVSGVTFGMSLFKKSPVQWCIFGVSLIFMGLTIILFFYAYSHQDLISDNQDSVLKYCWDNKGIKYFRGKGDWIAIVIAFISMVYAVFTWQSQRDTQRNTQGITPEVQKGILIDYGRHYYRNVIVLGAVMYLLREDIDRYPSEDHILKLQTDDRSIYPEAFDHDEYACSSLHKFKLNIRNGNIEIKTALKHLKIRELSTEYKMCDLNKLMSRMDYIMQQAVANICMLYSQSREYTAKEMLGRLNEVLAIDSHNKKVKIKKALEIKEVKEHIYYDGKKIKNGEIETRGFVKALFPDEEDKKKDEEEYKKNRKIRQLNDMPTNDREDEETWKIKDIHSLLDYVNAEIQLMLDARDEDAVVMLPFI